MRGAFVAGTDTGVGKTEVGRALLSLWAAGGLRPRALKPLETGCAPEEPPDALALRAACGAPHDALPLDDVCPLRLSFPGAPLMAAEAAGVALEVARLESALARALAAPGPLLVEAAGGLLVPLWRERGSLVTNLDLAARVGLPIVLVGRARLGTLNHCALSVRALRERGLACVAIVLNRAQDDAGDPTVERNAALLAELTGVPVFGPTAYVPEPGPRLAALASALAPLAALLV